MRNEGGAGGNVLVLGRDSAGAAAHDVHTSPDPAVEWKVYRTLGDAAPDGRSVS